MLLLEVLIALALIVLCAIPLIAPHVELLRGQRRILTWIELDHTVNRLYVDILQKLHENALPWKELQRGHHYPITPDLLTQLGYKNPPPKEAFYFFEDAKHKSNAEGVSLYKMQLNICFAFSGTDKAFHYTYMLPIAYFAANSTPPPPSNTAESEPEPEKETQTKKKGKSGGKKG